MFTLSPVSPAQIDLLKTALAAQATIVEPITPSVTPGKYMIRGHGVVASALYDTADSSLVVTITKKPFFVKESHIAAGLVAELTALGAATVVKAPAVPVAAAAETKA